MVKGELVRGFSSDLIRFYYGADLIGNRTWRLGQQCVAMIRATLIVKFWLNGKKFVYLVESLTKN